MKIPSRELIVASRLEKYPPPPLNENASLKRWRSFSPYWWSVIQGLIEGLLQPVLWRDGLTDEIRDEISKHFLPEVIDECEECKDCDNGNSDCGDCGGGGGCGCAENEGQLGLSVPELESLIMSSITAIRGYNGKLQVKYFGCCDWVDVEGFTGEIISSGDVPVADLPGSSFLDDVSKLFPKLPYTVPAPTGHTTQDAIKCAKATAMQDGLFVVLYEFRDLLDEIQLSNVTVAGILGYMTGVFLSGGWALAATIFTVVAGYVNDQAIDDLRDEIQEDWMNTALRTEIICRVTPKLTSTTEISADDFRELIKAWYEVFEPSGNQKRIIEMLPASFTRKVMQELLPQTPCACDQYKPYGYEPPSNVTGVMFSIVDTAKGNVQGLNALTSIGGLPYEQAFSVKTGVMLGGGQVDGVFTGVDSDAGGNQYNSRFSVVIECTQMVKIVDLKVQLAMPDGTLVYSGPSSASRYVYGTFNEETQLWNGALDWPTATRGTVEAQEDIIDLPGAAGTYNVFSKHWLLHWGARHTGSYKRLRLTGILFTGISEDGSIGFVDLPLNVEYP